MPIGPGKYDPECTEVRDKTQANGVVLMIFGGNRGHGFSVISDLETLLTLPKRLRYMADQIEKDTPTATQKGEA